MSLYDTLQVKVEATPEQIKKAYRKLAGVHHPDKGGDAEVFKELVAAYNILSDSDKRQRYDSGESAENIQKATMDLDTQILNSLLGLFVMVVAQVQNVDNEDLIQIMRLNVKHSMDDIDRQVKSEELKIKRFETAIRKLKTQNENNYFVQASMSQIAGSNARITALRDQRKVGEGGMKFLEAYSYEVDPLVMQISMGTGPSFTFTTFTGNGG